MTSLTQMIEGETNFLLWVETKESGRENANKYLPKFYLEETFLGFS